ncbi:hypothetical protein [Actinoallomurus acanthiterrae]
MFSKHKVVSAFATSVAAAALSLGFAQPGHAANTFKIHPLPQFGACIQPDPGDPASAAYAWTRLGCPYDTAMALLDIPLSRQKIFDVSPDSAGSRRTAGGLKDQGSGRCLAKHCHAG